MSRVNVAFYRAERDGHALDDAISLYTRLFNPGTEPYSHVEIWWQDKDGSWENGQCYTSTMRGNVNGNVIRPAKDIIYKHPERWDVFEIEVDDIKFRDAKNYARIRTILNEGYDKMAILGFFFPFRIGTTKDICSEAVQYFLYICGVFNKKKTWSPRRFSKKLINLGYEPQQIVEPGPCGLVY